MALFNVVYVWQALDFLPYCEELLHGVAARLDSAVLQIGPVLQEV